MTLEAPSLIKNSMRQETKRQFVNFCFFKVRPEWKVLDESVKEKGRQDFVKASEEYAQKFIVLSYSTVGLRADCDFMLWRISEQLEHFQKMTVHLSATGFGKYLEPVYSYLCMTKRSLYVDKISPEHSESRTRIVPGKYKYLFVYPFVKMREWYLLPLQKRQAMMDEHIRIGNKYPTVKLNTTYSFGIDDQEFVVAFETDSPQDFLDLVMELRESEGSKYTLRDTPTFTCVLKPVREIVADL